MKPLIITATPNICWLQPDVPYPRLREAEQAFNRWADPREIAEAAYFLASDAASFITGSDLLVDGGWVAK